MKTSEYIRYLSDNTYIIYIYIIIIHNYIYILVCVLFFFSRFFWNLFQSWNISTALSLQSEVILEGFISHVCYPLRVCQAEMNTVHVLSSGPPSCHLGVGMSIKVKRWFEVGPNWQSFAQIRDVKRPKIIKDDQTSGRKLYFYVFPHLHSYIFSTFFCFLFCFLSEAADFALESHCLWGQQSFRPAWFQFVLDHKPKLFARKWDPWKFCRD